MERFVIIAMILHFAVNFILILAASRLTDCYLHPGRAALGALIGCFYAAASTVPRLSFLDGPVWYGVSLFLICLTAFGMDRDLFCRGMIFSLLRIALDANGRGSKIYFLYGITLCGIGLLTFLGHTGSRLFVPVELQYRQKTVKLTALRDTGNLLRDPVSGKPVMIVGADIAKELTGLTGKQLLKPVDVIGAIPGLRLIPYKTVGESGKMLLALQIPNTKIGGRYGSSIVAFAPENLDENGKYQALIGGI